ncbi:Flagellar L-ring protein precursor [compost metagenome]
MKRFTGLALAAAVLVSGPLPALADSLYTEGPNENPTSFYRPYLGVGNLITVVVTENNQATSGASTERSKDARVRADWDFGTLIPRVVKNATDLRGRDEFKGEGVTSRNGRLTMDVTARIEEILPNGTLRIVGTKRIRVNEEETEITIRGIIRPLDITPDNRIASDRLADMEVDFKGTGPASAKATPGILTRLFNWLF